ncbi:MerR family transcriptional regulator [Deinococcus sp. QL22]|uniref:MerR family transcriptional regulator n=1 Tax=Deinococcus sp. QL22 TaxID=2939437 RepID=UPI002017082E|nr:MerR family transcriptional regulator [Deinococcus sp. QL22]UQN09732.1 MerR family transcriptional regulator [Deinococcus sp. QL22]
MLDVAGDWAGGIEQLVDEANARLLYLLPEDRSARPKDEVNARLVRHYTTQGLLSAPRREGREARYTRRHLLELLALRRLMADGLGGKVLMSALEYRTEEELAALAVQGSDGLEGQTGLLRRERQHKAQPVQPDTEALSYLNRIRERSALPPALLSPAPPQDNAPLVFFQSAPQQIAGITGRPSSSPPPYRKPQTLTRLEVRRGLELQVRSKLAWPQTSGQWDALMNEIRASLLVLQRESQRASANDAGAAHTEDMQGEGEA